MSSRQLRKLQRQKELEQLQEEVNVAANESSQDDEPQPNSVKPRQSMFAALGGADDDDDDEDKKSDETPEEEAKSEPDVPQPAAKKNKNKKKKKKAKKQAAPAEDEAGKSDVDEIDRALEELRLARNTETDTASATDDLAQRSRDVDELLQINTQCLRVIHEMRAQFGREAIQQAQEEERAALLAARRAQWRTREVDMDVQLLGDPYKKLPEITMRRNIFIQGKDTWPRSTAVGLVMEEVKKGSDGVVEYAYVHEEAYDSVQIMFFSCVQLGEPIRLVHLLLEFPYHISSLLQVSRIAIEDGNHALAADLCERALFTFGRATISSFRQKLEQGKARMDFKRPENRELWLAGSMYIKSLIRKGTHRTALEWAKLIFSLNSNDPYGMKYYIHVLAIRARQAQWLIDFLNTPKYVADETDDRYVKQTLVLAKLMLGDAEGAKIAAVAGMESMPWLYCSLFQALNLEAPPPLWGVLPDTDEREFWTNLYIHQAKELWNNEQAIGVLKEAVKIAKKPTQSLPQDNIVDKRTARWVWLEDAPGLLSGIPRHIKTQEPNYAFDPLPPLKEENIFTSQGTQLPWREGGQGMLHEERALLNMVRRRQERRAELGFGEEDLADGAMLEAFPNVDGGAVGEDEVAEATVADDAPSGGLLGGFQALFALARDAWSSPGNGVEGTPSTDSNSEEGTGASEQQPGGNNNPQ